MRGAGWVEALNPRWTELVFNASFSISRVIQRDESTPIDRCQPRSNRFFAPLFGKESSWRSKRLYLPLSFSSVARGEKKGDIDRNRYPRKTSSRADDLGRRRFCDDTRPWLIVERINERHTVGSSGFGWFANRSFNRTQRHSSHSLALWSVFLPPFLIFVSFLLFLWKKKTTHDFSNLERSFSSADVERVSEMFCKQLASNSDDSKLIHDRVDGFCSVLLP